MGQTAGVKVLGFRVEQLDRPGAAPLSDFSGAFDEAVMLLEILLHASLAQGNFGVGTAAKVGLWDGPARPSCDGSYLPVEMRRYTCLS
jgi:hypothetical protein